MTSPFEELGESVVEELDRDPRVVFDGSRRHEQRARLIAAEPSPGRAWHPWRLAMASMAVALLALGLFWALNRPPEPLQCKVRGGRALAAGDWIDAPQGASEVVDFSEGSSVRVESGARLRIFHLDAKRVHLAVENGRVESSVHKGATWTIGAGPYSAEVIGTQFSVAWAPETRRMRVEVKEGMVRVRGIGIQKGGIEVRAQQRLDAHVDTREVRLRKKPETEPAGSDARVELADRGTDTTQPRARRAPPRPLDSRWRKLAKEGRHRAALTAARRSGFGRLLARLTASDLLLLADAARLAGDRPRAGRALKALRQRFGRHPAAPRAAFRLGRLAAEGGNQRSAARWFRAFLAEARTNDAFAGDAQGRLMVALERSGDLRSARKQARRYLARYPKGAYAATAQSLLREK
ncbi:MAG: FecR domain-containing protein [Deltaproteobacteria bacterium]|nr:FecR domain-containing protein [Deltaproteobacteria bacterium]